MADALEHFARTGQGFIREMGGGYRLYVKGASADIAVGADRVHVLRVIRR